IRVQKLEVISRARLARALLFVARALRFAATVMLVYLYLLLVLSFFPWTRRLSGEIVGWVVGPLSQVLGGMIGYLPSLFTILVIVAVTYYGTKLVKRFFLAIEQRSIRFSGFYPEWARPTYKIVRFLIIALAVIMVWPYLPNSESQAFRGVAAFLGLLITFGSAGMIANVVGGIMLTYMRAFHVGDRVRIADTVGDVVEQNLLVTRVRTSKSVDVTIPNSLVLGTHIINWSMRAREGGVLLHTTVTIGYDAPWRQVHGLLIAAAKKTDLILADPAPFVLQTSLNDFHVSYELNVWTLQPERMMWIHSRLHENIQDAFNEAGIEILSPSYGALRDGNTVAMPTDYLPPAYKPEGFLFRRK
ncbi:MAG TPA: mechanosensitive ion channel family protein, partial [Longimicrobiales bacterium]|nr:mechanosensitive ion channel family protein [Longimicrobiales bacterium]